MSDTANAKDETIELKLTEWEFDTICKALANVNYPGTHIDVSYKLIDKLRKIAKEVNKNGNC